MFNTGNYKRAHEIMRKLEVCERADLAFVFIEKTDLYCPNCGYKSVVVEVSDGDYYDGPRHYCYECYFVFYLNG